jgi:hypothetical protein
MGGAHDTDSSLGSCGSDFDFRGCPRARGGQLQQRGKQMPGYVRRHRSEDPGVSTLQSMCSQL